MKYLAAILIVCTLTSCYDPKFRLYQATVYSDVASGEGVKSITVKKQKDTVLYFDTTAYKEIIVPTYTYDLIQRLKRSALGKIDYKDTLYVTSADGVVWHIPYSGKNLLFNNYLCMISVNIDSLLEQKGE